MRQKTNCLDMLHGTCILILRCETNKVAETISKSSTLVCIVMAIYFQEDNNMEQKNITSMAHPIILTFKQESVRTSIFIDTNS